MGVAALFAALVAVGQTGAAYDAQANRLEARGAAAADIRAPNAQVARFKAERQARARAAAKLKAALKELGVRGAKDELLDQAETSDVRYGSDGSVDLKLTLSTKTLDLKLQ